MKSAWARTLCRLLVSLETHVTVTRGLKALVENARLIAGVFILACTALGSGCAALAPQSAELGEKGLPAGVPRHLELTQVPFFPQDEYQCGPAALATALSASGVKITPQELVP